LERKSSGIGNGAERVDTKMKFKITSQIQSTLTSNLERRAFYLYNCYVSMSKNIEHINYLDVGCGYGVNSSIFGQDFNNVICLDFNLSSKKVEECRSRINSKSHNMLFFVSGDAQSLPFKPECFDLVSAFSVIEHVPDKSEMLRALLDVLKKDGELVLQFPNKYFFMELHTGLPAYFLIPSFIKPWFLRKIGYEGLLEINIPTIREIQKMIEDLGVFVDIKKSKVIYPIETIPPRLRWLYSILKRTKVLNLVPMGWMLCIKKRIL
jgi:ubiquinone/menaquinone biosynthesis C-methylase UbiE